MKNALEEIRRFIDPSCSQAIRDPVWQHIWVPLSLIPLLSSPAFLKLQGIKQLGPTSLVYPGATHSRYNHSLGVFNVAKRFLDCILADPSAEGFISVSGAKSFLCAALVHDLGHFPYTHSLKELPLKEHEVLTAELVLSQQCRPHLEDAAVDAIAVAAIVDTGLPCTDPELLFYRNVLSGVLDPDKLDYLNRDAYFCGVPYGIQDLDFILSRLYVHERTQMGIESTGLSSIEHVLFSKYLMYKTVYWHKSVRTATAMIKRSLFCALEQNIIDPEDLYNLDDSGFVSLAHMHARSFPAFEMVELVQRKQFHDIVLEIPFDSANQSHQAMCNLEFRSKCENSIAEFLNKTSASQLRSWEVVIDIPENVSFESGIPVRHPKETLPYLQTATVFTAAVVKDFTASLRMVRVLLPKTFGEISPSDRSKILEMLSSSWSMR